MTNKGNFMDDIEFEILMDGNKKRNKTHVADDIKDLAKLAISSSLVGGAIGAGSKAISGASSFRSLLRPAGKGAATGAALALSAGVLGKMLREKNDEDPNANAKQIGLGGAVLGGISGGVGGGLLAQKFGSNTNRLKNLAFKKFTNITSPHFVDSKTSFIRRGAKKAGTLKSAAIAAALGAIAGGLYGADEGSALDIIENASKKRKSVEVYDD